MLTREDLDSALQKALPVALRELSEKVVSDVRQELRQELKQFTAALQASDPLPGKEDSNANDSIGEPLTLVPGTSREISIGSNRQDGYERLDPDPFTEQGKHSGHKAGRKSAALKALETLTREGRLKKIYRPDAPLLEVIVTDPKFEQTAGMLVMLNMLALGFETQVACINHGDVPEPWRSVIAFEERAFCILFLTEWILRVVFAGKAFFIGEGWRINVFDTVVIGLQVFEQVFSMIAVNPSRQLHNALNMVRILRVVRMVRLLHLFKELQTRVKAIVESLSSLATTLVLMGMTIYTFSIIFAQLFLEASTGPDADFLKEGHFLGDEVAKYFSSLPRTALTLLECITDGKEWDDPVMIIYESLGLAAVPLFMLYEMFGVFVILNVIMGVFIDKAIKVAEDATELNVACAISKAFIGDGMYQEEVTWEVFEQKLAEPELQECFEMLKVDIGEAKVLFELIDADHSGSVDAREIVEGCLKLKGTAKALDMSIMLQTLNIFIEKVDSHVSELDRTVRTVDDRVCRLGKKLGVRTLHEAQ